MNILLEAIVHIEHLQSRLPQKIIDFTLIDFIEVIYSDRYG